MIVFGPVPSRRLGHSLGINNIPPKACSYSCVYCQVGPTAKCETQRRSYYSPEAIAKAVSATVGELRSGGKLVDFLTFVPDGEPTLDINLARVVDHIRELHVPIALITNGSLLWRKEIRDDLRAFDFVSVKVDTIREEVWRQINRPDPSLQMEVVLDGIRAFSREFEGTLVTETMLVKGLNDRDDLAEETATFLAQLRPRIVYLAIPTRPPSESWCEPPDELRFNSIYQIFRERLPFVECLVEEARSDFEGTGDMEEELLAITSVHPMTHEAIEDFVRRKGAAWAQVEGLIEHGSLRRVQYRGQTFYLRAFGRSRGQPFAQG